MDTFEHRLSFDDIRDDALACIDRALAEDRADADITTGAVLTGDESGIFHLISKDRGVLAGLDIFRLVFSRIDKDIVFESAHKDGAELTFRETIATVKGRVASLLKGERVALNFIQHLSGIASRTAEAVEAVKEYHVKILDTRKTVPGMRRLQKYAVCVGGGYNHRMTLNDMFLIKDNHIRAAGGVREALTRVRKNNPDRKIIEVELDSIADVKAALEILPDVVMLDNMDDIALAEAKKLLGRIVKIEVSGNITMGRLVTLGRLGVDYISIGSLTHSVKAHDFSFKMA
ncbi:MAG: carboxylating nicotinate-nucleotide diphosphorylase [Spirochaetota bacterium]